MPAWTEQEVELLDGFLAADMTYNQISEEMGVQVCFKTIDSIRSFLARRRLPEVTNPDVETTKINPHALKKSELIDLMTKRCRHGHSYLEHPSCWYKEGEKQPKVGYLDIETSNLKANYGMILTYVIKTQGKKEYLTNVIKRKDILARRFDKAVVKQLVEDMSGFDCLIGYFSSRFDMPFIRTRAMIHNIPFPAYGHIQHKDVYYMVKFKMCLNSNRLEVATNTLGIAGKNHVIGPEWTMAGTGDAKALKYVLDHNIRDCDILEELHMRLEPFIRPGTKSL